MLIADYTGGQAAVRGLGATEKGQQGVEEKKGGEGEVRHIMYMYM